MLYNKKAITFLILLAFHIHLSNEEMLPILNQKPNAIIDHVFIKNTITIIDTLENDIDPDGDKLTIMSVGKPTFGQVKIVNNQLEYTINDLKNFTQDSFNYTISDANLTDTAVVKIYKK